MQRSGLLPTAFGIVLLACLSGRASNELEKAVVQKRVLILQSVRRYDKAQTTASQAAGKLGVKLDLEGYVPNPKIGLSLSEKGCADNGVDYPCYVARGREEDATYVSIEYSNAYPGFQKGYYLVVLATAPLDDDTAAKQALAQARAIYADAYMKRTSIYMGCMH